MNWDYNLEENPGRPAGKCPQCEHYRIFENGDRWCEQHGEYVDDNYSCYDFVKEEELI